MTSTQSPKIHRIFWLYLLAVHSVYALILTRHFDFLGDHNYLIAGIAFPEWASAFDLVLLPTLIYMWCARKHKLQALLGGFSMAALGLFAIRVWYPSELMSADLVQLLALRQKLMPLIWILFGAFEIYFVLIVLKHLRKPMKEGAIELMLAPLIATLGANNGLIKFFAAEQRMWIYGLSKTLPKPSDFVGDLHFSYAKQNGNASTWYGFFVVNTLPIPILHFVLAPFSQVLAWVVTILTGLSSFWLWAEYRATQARPVSLDVDTLYLRYGTWTDLRIDRKQIVACRALSWRDFEPIKGKSARPIQLQGMGAANVELTLDDGRVYRIGLDEPAAFMRALGCGASTHSA